LIKIIVFLNFKKLFNKKSLYPKKMKVSIIKILLLIIVLTVSSWGQDYISPPKKKSLFNSETYLNHKVSYNKYVYRNINTFVSFNSLKNLAISSQNSKLASRISKDDNLFLSYKIFTNDIKYNDSYKTILHINRITPQEHFRSYNFSYLSQISFSQFSQQQSMERTFQLLDFHSPYGKKLLANTVSWVGFGVGMLGALMLMPKSFTKWEDGFIDDAKSNLNRAFSSPPVWDEDLWAVNYVGHPVAGSFYYNALRSNNSTVFQSFLFSLYASTVWEYVFEGVAEQPSTQDLFVTPIVGSILGESIHQITLGMRKNGFSFFEKVFVTIFNPMYAINNGYH
jgi:hypothetical protein